MSKLILSRQRLAAALIEYDNDPAHPETFRSAKDSAIFATARRLQPEPEVQYEPRRASYDARSTSDTRASVMVPPTVDDHESDPEVDLASWGLDSFMKPQKKSKKNDAKLAEARAAVGRAADQTHQRSLSIPLPVQADSGDTSLPARPSRIRSATLNNMDSPGHELLRNSLASPLDRVGANVNTEMQTARPVSMFAAVDLNDRPAARSGSPSSRDLVSFPADAHDSDSPFAIPLSRPTSRFDPKFTAHTRTLSSTSAQLLDNPFSVPSSPGQTSVRDSRAVHARTLSSATRLSKGPYTVPEEEGYNDGQVDDEYHVPLTGARTGDARLRTTSIASLGSRIALDSDAAQQRSRPAMPDRGSWRYSKLDLMRPKVLVMPQPLQSGEGENEGPVLRDGFLHSTDGPPLPPGARTNAVATRFPSSNSISASNNGLTFNPRASLTLAQLTFRNTLTFDGQRDVSYVDIDAAIPRVEDDGEQATVPIPEEPDEFGQLRTDASPRQPGSLYGRSLMDDLERRKAQMKGRQRVFKGDDRPSMMQRGRVQSTLIDPTTLQRSASGTVLDQTQDPQRSRMGPRTSSAPLLDFDRDRLGSDVAKTKSVFGVDQLWEKELAKLQKIEEAERQAEAENERRAEAKVTRKRRGKAKATTVVTPGVQTDASRAASPPPLLPNVPATGGKPVPTTQTTPSESESEEEVKLHRPRRSSVGTFQTLGAKGWFASSDEEDGKVGAPSRKPRQAGQPRQSPAITRKLSSHHTPHPPDSDSDDIPLAAQLSRIARSNESDSDEDKPLAALAEKARAAESPLLPLPVSARETLMPESVFSAAARKPDVKHGEDDDDDDLPLGLRQSQSRPVVANDDDDDKPLGLKRMTQFPGMTSMPMMPAQMPVFTPQQMLMQAQMQHASMYPAPPSLMGSYAPFLGAPMMPVLPVPTPVSQDSGTFGRVDRWRRDIVDNGEVS